MRQYDAHHASGGVQAWFETAKPFRHHERASLSRTTTRSVRRRLWPSVQSVGVGHSEPPVKGNRLRSLEPLCPRRVQGPTQRQEAPPSTSEGRVAPSAVGWGSSLSPSMLFNRNSSLLNPPNSSFEIDRRGFHITGPLRDTANQSIGAADNSSG